jgi:hypothetical protein
LFFRCLRKRGQRPLQINQDLTYTQTNLQS